MSNIRVDVNTSGPVFDGRAHAAAKDGLSDGIKTLTQEAKLLLSVQFVRDFRQPNGYYEDDVEARMVNDLEGVVDDSDVIYGHWLQGDGSRNYPVTSFKGYAPFPMVHKMITARAERVVDQAVEARLRTVGV
jgi:hypothetical protein